MELQNTGGMPQAQFAGSRDKLLPRRTPTPSLSQVRLSQLPDSPTLKVNVDQPTLASLGIAPADVNATLSTAWGGNYVNDFVDRGRVKRVYLQGDAPYRAGREDLDQWSVRNNQGGMVSFASFAQPSWTSTPVSLYASTASGLRISGQSGAGQSSGQAMNEITARRAIPGHRCRLGGPIVPAAAVVGAGADPLRHVADRRLPVPRGAVRKLVDPGRGAAGHPARASSAPCSR